MMNEPLFWLLALLAGALLGLFFFGGLWWTIQKGMTAPNAGLWFLGSFLLRTSVTLAGFYFVSAGHWERLVACLLGFVVARFVIVRLKRSEPPQETNRSANF